MASAESNDKLTPRKRIDRVIGSMPWLKVRDIQRYRVKVFKSGNSLAVRLPAGLELPAGTEMDLRVEDGRSLSLEPVERPRRKFNVAKVCGSASSLRPIEDRSFDERPLAWGPAPRAGTE